MVGRLHRCLQKKPPADWPDRILVTDSQRVKDPIKWRQSSVMTSEWRLINGKELYQIKSDPGQKKNVASEHPQVVARLTQFYEQWWTELLPSFKKDAAIYLGHPQENPARLTCHDWITTGSTPWNQGHVRSAVTGDRNTGFWNVKVVEAGDYEIRLRRWPQTTGLAIDAQLEPGASVPGAKAYRTKPGKPIAAVKATIEVAGVTDSTEVAQGAKEVIFNLKLPAGKTRLSALFHTADGDKYGAYYAYVKRK